MTRPLRADAERNKARLLEAAAELFARKGLSVGLDEIARHAGVGVATAYRRFPDKDQLIDALFEERMAVVVQLAHDALAEPDAWDALTGFIFRVTELQMNDQGLKELLFGDPRHAARVEAAREQVQPLFDDLVARAGAAGALRADVGPSDLSLLQFMVTGLSAFGPDLARQLWPRYLQIVLDGLCTPAPTPLPGGPPDEDALAAAALRG